MKKGLLFMLALTAAFLCPLTVSAGDLGENLGFETKEISESQKQAILRSRKLSFSVQRSEKNRAHNGLRYFRQRRDRGVLFRRRTSHRSV